jgi:hypothetical protein
MNALVEIAVKIALVSLMLIGADHFYSNGDHVIAMFLSASAAVLCWRVL